MNSDVKDQRLTMGNCMQDVSSVSQNVLNTLAERVRHPHGLPGEQDEKGRAACITCGPSVKLRNTAFPMCLIIAQAVKEEIWGPFHRWRDGWRPGGAGGVLVLPFLILRT